MPTAQNNLGIPYQNGVDVGNERAAQLRAKRATSLNEADVAEAQAMSAEILQNSIN